ncbi:28S ribosomal protein S15, mitochondrial [Agrilus planipennis]|uniref:Small ribosomal subunit protein uS15m n=1 Tax=Agrilus planipennis TaxID=224129 RepID=A0A1W4WJA0_AGRPL|nr:28S ribosomal protein S15, mitochondrial [Agrilus planipennis]
MFAGYSYVWLMLLISFTIECGLFIMNTMKKALQFSSRHPMLTFKNVIVRSYAFKSNLKIKWVRPEKIPCFKPEKSGDLDPMPEFDKSRYQLEYANCKELENADPLVKRLFSLEFASRSKITQAYKKDLVDSVKNHTFDENSIEARIARWTGTIRALQEVMENHPRNRRLKVQLKEIIDKRKKYLKFLRTWDYKKFEWLIDNLNIIYKPPPPQFHWITRKDSLRKLTQKYCDDKVNEKLSAYRLQLEAEQPAFLEEKIRTLEFLRQEQKDCGVEITIKQEEIDEAKKSLDELRKKNEKGKSSS